MNRLHRALRLLLTPAVLAVALLNLTGCYTVPGTNRSALNLVPESQLAAMSQQGFEDLKRKEKISQNPTYNAMLRRVGGRVATVVTPHMPGPTDWEFVVFDNDETLNAFAMPGGKVGIYTGMWAKKIVQSEDDLATIIGHEIAHVVARHGNERVSQSVLAGAGGIALTLGTREMDADKRKMILAAYGAGATLGVILPYSRGHESEADYLGILYAAEAGYDPRSAIKIWERMGAAASGARPPEFLSTHPSTATRIRELEAAMPDAMAIYNRTRGTR